jgi:hypothetical protein
MSEPALPDYAAPKTRTGESLVSPAEQAICLVRDKARALVGSLNDLLTSSAVKKQDCTRLRSLHRDALELLCGVSELTSEAKETNGA